MTKVSRRNFVLGAAAATVAGPAVAKAMVEETPFVFGAFGNEPVNIMGGFAGPLYCSVVDNLGKVLRMPVNATLQNNSWAVVLENLETTIVRVSLELEDGTELFWDDLTRPTRFGQCGLTLGVGDTLTIPVDITLQ